MGRAAKLDRSFKEVLVFAASMAAKSDYGTGLHLKVKAVQVVQLFIAYTNIADGLRLGADFDSLIQAVGQDQRP